MQKNFDKFNRFFIVFSLVLIPLIHSHCKKLEELRSKAAPMNSKVTFIKGSVKINGKDAQLGQTIENTARIKTEEKSLCEIVFNGNNIIQIQPNTEATLNLAKTIKEVELRKGGIASVLKNLEKLMDHDSFRVRTVTTVAGVRGTTFFAHIEGTKTYVCDCNGTVTVSDIQKTKSETLKNIHHGARVFTLEGGKIKVEEGTLEHHDDKLMDDLAAKINTRIDWTKVE